MTTSSDKVRIGIAMGGWPFPEPDPQMLWDYTDRMESLDIDSIWFTDRIVSPLLSLVNLRESRPILRLMFFRYPFVSF